MASRRNMLKASMTGLAGIEFAWPIGSEQPPLPARDAKSKSVILLWMTGGGPQSDRHLGPKPDRPYQNRGPFGVISTKMRGANLRALAQTSGHAGQVHYHSLGRCKEEQP